MQVVVTRRRVFPLLLLLLLIPVLGRAQTLRPAKTFWATAPAEVPELADRIDSLLGTGDLVPYRSQIDGQLPGRSHERLDQYHQGVRVWGGQMVLQKQSGRIVSVTGNLYQDIAVETAPTVDPDDLISRFGGLNTDSGLRVAGPVELVILPLSDRFALAYFFRLRGRATLESVFVDAHSGGTLLRFNALRTDSAVGLGFGTWSDEKKMSIDQTAGTFRASDLLRPAGIKTFDVGFDFVSWNTYNSATDAFLARDPDNRWEDGAVVDAHVYSGFVYDYYFKRHGRRGLDNRDLVAINFVHFLPQSAGYNNAFFDPVDNSMNYGDGDGTTFNYICSGVDVVAHELTHGVTQFSSDLIYLNESGALNEAFSDVMGASVEFYAEPAGSGRNLADWLLGEDVFFAFGRFSRSFADPGAAGDPDHYSKRCLPPECSPDAEGDNGGVHTNSGIMNHAFYLMIEGGTNRTSGLSVQGVGRSRMDRIESIFYRAFTFFLVPSSDFSDARAATLAAARELYGAGSPEEQAVFQGWNAVGVQ